MYKTESCSNRVESAKCRLATKMTKYIDTREERGEREGRGGERGTEGREGVEEQYRRRQRE